MSKYLYVRALATFSVLEHGIQLNIKLDFSSRPNFLLAQDKYCRIITKYIIRTKCLVKWVHKNCTKNLHQIKNLRI